MNIVDFGLYTVKDEYFNKYKSTYFSDNKKENRPYYLSLTDKDGIIWLIPLSSQIEAYRAKIKKDTENKGSCLFYHIGIIHKKESVFLIGNIFPVTPLYLSNEYTYSNIHYIVKNATLIKEISKRTKKFLALVKSGKLKPNVDIMAIKNDLLKT